MKLRGMERGKQQVLFSYLPESTFDYEGGGLICKVTSLEGKQVVLRDDSTLREEIRNYVLGTKQHSRWDESRVRGFPDPVAHPADFEFVDPMSVRFDVFPCVWQCGACRRVFAYRDIREASDRNPSLTCRYCRATRLRQVYHVFVHECGTIEPAGPPHPCPRHPRSPLVLDDRRSQQTREFRWVCPECRTVISRFVRRCPRCSGGDDKAGMSPLPHRAGPVYYPHYVRVVNLTSARADRSEERGRRALVRLIGDEEGSNADASDHLRRALQGELPDAVRQQVRAALEQMSLKAVRTPRVPENAEPRDVPAIEAYLTVTHDLRVHSVEHAASRLDGMRAGLGGRLRAVPDTLNRCGVVEAMLVENFPVLTAVFGYTRNGFDPEIQRESGNVRTTFRGFPVRLGQAKHPIYVDVGETEAVVFRLDAAKVVRWLGDGGLPDLPEPGDADACRLWLACEVERVNRVVGPLDPESPTAMVFGLVHSMSHCLSRAVALLGGFERSSVAEYLFPQIPAFVLFSNRTDFSVGGMWTFFEDHLADAFVKAFDLDARACVYDPVCLDHGGACHACLHMPEISCAHLNASLSRCYLFGGEVRGRRVPGYWSDVTP